MRNASIVAALLLPSALWAHGSHPFHALIQHAPLRAFDDARTPEEKRRSAGNQALLFQAVQNIQPLARAIITDLNDEVGTLNARHQNIGRQRTLQRRDMPNGYGMKRWPVDEFDRRVATALADANDLLERYRSVVPWVEIEVNDAGIEVIAALDAIECLAGRPEHVAIVMTNATNARQSLRVVAQDGSIDIAAPPRLSSVGVIPFSIRKPGEFALALELTAGENAMGLELAGVATKACRFTLNIVNADTKKRCAARASIRGSDGRYWIAGNRPVTLAGQRAVHKFGYADGRVTALVPPGEVTVMVRKGFEYEVAELTTAIRGKKSARVELERWVDMPAEGWYSGDTHVHWVRHTWHENGDPEWLNLHSRAEDLWVNNNLILKHWWENVVTDEFPAGLVANRPDWSPVGRNDDLSVNGRIVWTGEEYRNDEVFGHLCFLRIDKLIEPVSTGFMGGPAGVHWPPNSHTYDRVRDAGGITIAAHDVNMEVPIQVAMGKLDSLDAHNTTRYYDLLNCGYRLPLSIGSDYPANLMGFARVYVYCGEELDYDTWVDNLAAGRTFVSSGAMLTVEADGKTVGDTIALSPGEERDVTVCGAARCRNPLERVEIVYSGDVVARVAAEGDGRTIAFDESVSISGPGWLAARTYPENGVTWWGQPDAAHTAPIYISCGDERLTKPDAVNRMINVLRDGRRRAENSELYDSDEQKTAVLAYYENGIAEYERLLTK